ncbi:prepilin peptidase [Candidatus Peregrinibacteria bacterium]|nr:prepilin peptidase [Candidatus Peregrinibacteria bacterium]
MKIFFSVLIFILGISLGSFLSVVIPRLKYNKKGIIKGRSECPKCKTRLSASELIPLVSFLLLMGKCKNCKKPISWIYPTIELVTGIIFLIFFWKWYPHDLVNGKELSMNLLWLALELVYALVLIATFFYDLLYMEIPDKILIPAILLALTATVLPGSPHLIDALLGAMIPLAFFGLQIAVSGGRWMGGGDLRIGAFMGLILGWKLVILALMISYITGSIISVALIARKKGGLKTQIPFAPFLVTGTFLSMLEGEKILEWYFGLSL